MNEIKNFGIISGVSLIFSGIFLLYFYVIDFRLFIEGWNEYLESGAIVVESLFHIEVSILDVIGSTLCCRMYRIGLKTEKSWFETFVSCALLQYGGTTLTGLFLGELPPWLMTWPPFTGFLISWWLMFFCPYDLYWRFVSSPMVLAVYSFFGVFNNGHGVTSWGVDHALFNRFHINPNDISYSYIGSIICGTLSCCGGTIVCDWLRFTEHASYTMSQTPGVFRIGYYTVSREMNTSFLLALLYYTLVNTHNFLNLDIRMPVMKARGVVLLAQYYIYFLQSLLPEEVNVVERLSRFLLKLFLITPVVNGAEFDSKGDRIMTKRGNNEGVDSGCNQDRKVSSTEAHRKRQ